jgi:phosphoribosylaminoimidazole carboxylase PurK protein
LQTLGSFKDAAAIKQFASQQDFLTFEIESANAQALLSLQQDGKNLNPQPQMLALIKDKFAQKIFYQQHAIPCAQSYKVDSKNEIVRAADKIGYPFLLKARFDAYDGRGNALVRSAADIDDAMAKLGANNLYVEQFVPFVKELAVIVARDSQNNIRSYPVVETIHENNICHTVLCPAPISVEQSEQATQFAEQLVSHLEGAGVFAVEMFLSAQGEIIVNEVAPRVHNSGHHTLEANVTSQFEQHVRAVTGLPLGDPSLKVPAAVMMNILGERAGDANIEGLDAALAIDGVSVHFYGKAQTKLERKMGHITVVASDLATAQANALQAKKLLKI